MRSRRQHLGKQGECAAVRGLEARGYVILKSNHRTRYGEIDLVAEKNGVLVFVEVRARSSGEYGLPEESMTRAKRSHLIAAAEDYLQSNQAEGRDWRIDFVGLKMDSRGRVSSLDLIENAVEG